MNTRTRLKALALLLAVVATVTAGFALLASPPAEAARCCWVMVCSNAGCWEECRPCPKF